MRYSPNTPAPISPNQGHSLQYEYQPPIAAYPVAPVMPEAAYPPMPNYEPTAARMYVGTPEYAQALAEVAPQVDAIFGNDYSLTTAALAPENPPVLAMASMPNVYNSADPNAQGQSMDRDWMGLPIDPTATPAAPAAGGNGRSGSAGNGGNNGNGRGGFPGGGSGGSGPENNGSDNSGENDPFKLPDGLDDQAERSKYLQQLKEVVDYVGDQPAVSVQGIQAHIGVDERRAEQLLETVQRARLVAIASSADEYLLTSRITDPEQVANLQQQIDAMDANTPAPTPDPDERTQRAAAIASYRAGARAAARASARAAEPDSSPLADAADPAQTPPTPPRPATAPATPNTASPDGEADSTAFSFYGPTGDFNLVSKKNAYTSRGLEVPAEEQDGQVHLYVNKYTGEIVTVRDGDQNALAAIDYRMARETGEVAEDPALEAAYQALIHTDQTPVSGLRGVWSGSRARLRGAARATYEYLVDPAQTTAAQQQDPAQVTAPPMPATPPRPAAAPATPNTAPNHNGSVDQRVADIADLYDYAVLGRGKDAYSASAASRIVETRNLVTNEVADLFDIISAQHPDWTLDRGTGEVRDSNGDLIDSQTNPDAMAVHDACALRQDLNREAVDAVGTYVGTDLNDPEVVRRVIELSTDPSLQAVYEEWSYYYVSKSVPPSSPLLHAFEAEGIYFQESSNGYSLVDINGRPLENSVGQPIEGSPSTTLGFVLDAALRAKQELAPATAQRAHVPQTPAEIQAALDAALPGLTELNATYTIVDDKYVINYGPGGRRQITAPVDSWQAVALTLNNLKDLDRIASQQPGALLTLPGGVPTDGGQPTPNQLQPTQDPATWSSDHLMRSVWLDNPVLHPEAAPAPIAPNPVSTTPPMPLAPQVAAGPDTGPASGNTNDATLRREMPRAMSHVFDEVYDQHRNIDFYTGDEALAALRRMKVSADAYRAAERAIGATGSIFVDSKGNYTVFDPNFLNFSGVSYEDQVKARIEYMAKAEATRVANVDIENALHRFPTSGRSGKRLEDALDEASAGETPVFVGLRDAMYLYGVREKTPMSSRTKRRLLGSIAGVAAISAAIMPAALMSGGGEHNEARQGTTASASATPGSEAPSAEVTQSPESSPTASPSKSESQTPSPTASTAKPAPSKTAETPKPSASAPSSDADLPPKLNLPVNPGNNQPGAVDGAGDVAELRNGSIDVSYNRSTHEANGTIGAGGSTWKLAESILRSAKVDAGPAAIQHLTSDILAKGGIEWGDAPRVIDPGSTAKVTIDKDGAHVVSVDLK